MRPLTSHISDDIFLHIPSTSPPSPPSPPLSSPPLSSPQSPPSQSTRPNTLIFFITGNPGLISYYTEFLTLLSTSGVGQGCVVAGFSLGGFEVETSTDTESGSRDGGGTGDMVELERLQFPDGVKGRDRVLYGLVDQIELCYARVDGLVRWLRGIWDSGSRDSKQEKVNKRDKRVNVILMGHSVGAYIALEVIRLWHERYSADPPWIPKAAMLLMPTIIDLHKSPSGQLATPILSTLPFLPELMQLATFALRFGLPETWLKALVGKVTGMKPGQGLETTIKFLLSAKGVKQALHLARDELAQIRGDKWGAEIWGAAHARVQDTNVDANQANNQDTPILYFLFAGEDHWISETTRRQILENNEANRQRMILDQEAGLSHAWCLRQSLPVAQVVFAWLREIMS